MLTQLANLPLTHGELILHLDHLVGTQVPVIWQLELAVHLLHGHTCVQGGQAAARSKVAA